MPHCEARAPLATRSALHGYSARHQSPTEKELPLAGFPPVSHVALTVRDLSVSVPWYEALFDAKPVLDEDTDPDFHHTVYMVGIDHVSFGCADRAELQNWARRLDELGVEHGGIKDASYGSGVSFRDPDGIALEFFAPPA